MPRLVVATPISPLPDGIKFDDIAKLTDGLAKLAGLADKYLTPLVKKALPLVARATPAATRAVFAPAPEVRPDELTPHPEATDWSGDALELPADCGHGWESFEVSGLDLSGLSADWWG